MIYLLTSHFLHLTSNNSAAVPETRLAVDINAHQGFPVRRKFQVVYYLLPQVGKTLKIACNECDENTEDFTLFEYEWNGEKFVKK